MARPVILGNGALTVGLNEQGLVHDFYYPYVGLENLTTARSTHHKIGIWVDGYFSWVDDGSWTITVDFETDALISNVLMVNESLNLELYFEDFVDNSLNAFCRIIEVRNKSNERREVRVFMHQVFEISRAGRADTALYVPNEKYILDYKGRCSLLIYGEDSNGIPHDQFAIGNYGIEGKEGTFRDAEDGELSGSSVEHGGVDSVIRFSTIVEPKNHQTLFYWIVAADSQQKAEKLHIQIKSDGLIKRQTAVKKFWQGWLSTASNGLQSVDNKYIKIAKKSLMVIKAHCDKRGGIIASCDSSIYNYGRDYYSYVWPRDGAYVLWPLIRLGYKDEPRKFFEFCRDILDDDGYLAHKFQPDKAIGSTWHPLIHGKNQELAIQEDETASVIYMLGEYLNYSQDSDFVEGLYMTFVKPAANFLSTFVDNITGLPHASYDLWEEKFLTTTYSTAVTYQALLVASELATKFDYPDDASNWKLVAEKILINSSAFINPDTGIYRKGFLLQDDNSLEFDDTLDVSSFYGVMAYGLYNPTIDALHKTVSRIESTLLDQSPSGGSPRHENDGYFRSSPQFHGNPWSVTTLWLSQYYIRTKQLDKARKYMDWVANHALPSGVLSEQVDPISGDIISVTPLVWSHAEFINTALDLSNAPTA